ncbi:MAG: SpoIIIAH-like family protein [Bacillota bacterium]|nr:SpoIIIAH-like family protein [Bacillota bacterium]
MVQQEKRKTSVKKIVIVIVLILVLGAVGYLNYALNTNSEPENSMPSPLPSAFQPSASPTGESTDVDLEEALAASNTFFEDFRKEREATREKEIQYLDSIINDKNTDKETLADAQQRKIALTQAMETEMTIEGLIKAKGFEDAIVTLHKGSVNAVVKVKQLTQQQAAQIMDIVRRESGENGENIKIITRQ